MGVSPLRSDQRAMKTDEVCDRYLETFGRRYFWGYLRLILSVSWINTQKFYERVANSIARKGVQRVEDPLAGSRGSAPWVSPINTRKQYAVVTNSIARKGQGRNSLAGSRGSAPWVSKKRRGSRELLLSTRFCGISLRWLRRCTPAKCRAWIPPFQRGWSPARTRPRCTGCRGRSRSPCRNTRRTDAPAHASW